MSKSEKFFIWWGYVAWRFPVFFVLFIVVLVIFGLISLFASDIFGFAGTSAKGIVSFFVGFFSIFLGLSSLRKGWLWEKKERNWKVAAHKGARLAVKNRQVNSLFIQSFGMTIFFQNKNEILIWSEKEKLRAKLENEVAMLEEKLKSCSDEVSILPGEIKEAKEKLAVSEKELEALQKTQKERMSC